MELAVAASVSSSFTLSVDGGVTVLDVQETQIGDFGAINHKMWCYKTYLVRWMLVFFWGGGRGRLFMRILVYSIWMGRTNLQLWSTLYYHELSRQVNMTYLFWTLGSKTIPHQAIRLHKPQAIQVRINHRDILDVNLDWMIMYAIYLNTYIHALIYINTVTNRNHGSAEFSYVCVSRF